MQVLIVHTHGTESYSNADATTYNKNDSTRSQNNQESVIKVGDEMRKELESLGVNVIHDTTLHDIPSFNGSYTNSLKTINSYIKKYPTIKIVIDVHRDSMVTSTGVNIVP
jgi:stage II sporulation protein P